MDGWECSCPAWTRHTPRTDCKHIIKVQKASCFPPQNPCSSPPHPLTSQPTVTAPVSNPQGCAVIIDGYAIRRRAWTTR